MWSTWWWDVSSRGLGCPTLIILLVEVHMASLNLGLLRICRFSCQKLRVPGIFHFLGSPQHLWLCSHSFMNSLLRSTLPDFQAFIWNLGGSLYNPTTLALSVSVKLALCGQHQGMLPTEAAARALWTMVAANFECLIGWEQQNESWGTNSLGCPSQVGYGGTLVQVKSYASFLFSFFVVA